MAKKAIVVAPEILSEDAVIKIWAKAVDTQMHFNEMSVKSRQLGLTFVAAALGVAIVLLGQNKDFFLNFAIGKQNLHIHVSVFIIVAAAFAVLAVRSMDLGVYHRMLRGAVTFGEDFEEQHLKPKIKLNKGMTQAISHYSRNSDASVSKCAEGYQYGGSNHKTAHDKILRFYRIVITVLVASAVLMFFATNSNLRTELQSTSAQGSDGT